MGETHGTDADAGEYLNEGASDVMVEDKGEEE